MNPASRRGLMNFPARCLRRFRDAGRADRSRPIPRRIEHENHHRRRVTLFWPEDERVTLAVAMRPRYVRASAVRLHVEGQERDHVTPTLLPAGAIEALALCDAPLPVRLSLPPCSSHARGEPVATVRALPACAARCFCRHAADSAHSPWPEPCTFLRLCVALLRSEGMHRRLQDPVSMREEEVHRTF